MAKVKVTFRIVRQAEDDWKILAEAVPVREITGDLRSSGTSPNFFNTIASPKSPVAGSPDLEKRDCLSGAKRRLERPHQIIPREMSSRTWAGR
jgi:hypothetical protein